MNSFQFKLAILLGGLLIAVGGSPIAQVVHKTKPYKQMPSSSITPVYMGPTPPGCPGIIGSDFDNSDIFTTGPGDGWLSTDTGGGSCRWFSNAAKGAAANQTTNTTDLMQGIVFSYCSNALDVAYGGAGGSVTLAFYEGYTGFGGSPTTAVAVLSLTGMPADVADGSFLSPGASCYEMNLNFSSPIAFADNQFIGYSWQFDDIGTDGTYGNTYPFLSCVVSCLGSDFVSTGSAGGIGGNWRGLGEDGQGMLDVIDQFSTFPPSSFTFGGVPWGSETRTSINMKINEVAEFQPPVVSFNSTPPNADILGTTGMVIGSPWTATLVIQSSVFWGGEFEVYVTEDWDPNGVPFSNHWGLLLLKLPFSPIPPIPRRSHDGTTGSVTIGIPADLSLLCRPWAAQARSRLVIKVYYGSGYFTYHGPWLLSSAVRGQIGI